MGDLFQQQCLRTEICVQIVRHPGKQRPQRPVHIGELPQKDRAELRLTAWTFEENHEVSGNIKRLCQPLKRHALAVFTDRIAPGLWDHARKPDEQEWKATRIIRLKLDEVSAKVRTGAPIDEDDDYQLDAWAGIIPLRLIPALPEPDPKLRPGTEIPEFIQAFKL